MSTSTKSSKSRQEANREYASLVAEFPPRPIRTKADHNAALRVIEDLMSQQELSRAQTEYLDLLSMLVVQYEDRLYPLEPISLAALLAHLLAARGVSAATVAREARISTSLISDVLAERRRLSVENIRRLAAYFHVSTSLFVEARQ